MTASEARSARKARIREYKETPRTMGLYRVRNTESGRCLLGVSVDVPSILNRHRAQLRMGGHPARDLQRDWAALGPEAFAFEILDVLEPRDEPGYDPAADLRALEELWLEKLKVEGVTRYD